LRLRLFLTGDVRSAPFDAAASAALLCMRPGGAAAATRPLLAPGRCGGGGSDPTVRALHACTRFCAHPTSAWLHARDARQTGDDAAQLSALRPDGGLYWCERHTKTHICDARCRETYVPSAAGVEVCVLSQRVVTAAPKFAFGDGTGNAVEPVIARRRGGSAARRYALTHEAPGVSGARPLRGIKREIKEEASDADDEPAAATPGPEPMDTGGGGGLENAEEAPEEEEDDDEDEEEDGDDAGDIDPDAPADDLFSDVYEVNTFGEDCAALLAQRYNVAYQMVHLVMFSDQRAQIEANLVEARVAEAQGKIDAYLEERAFGGDAATYAYMSTCRALHDTEVFRRRVYPQLILPRHGTRRLTAYFAMLCVEFYTQLRDCAARVRARAHARKDGKVLIMVDRLSAYKLAHVVPNILDMAREGISENNEHIIERERLLALFPGSNVVQMLGIDQKPCTEIKKDIKRCITLALDAREPVSALRVTSLSMVDVLFSPLPVISRLFLDARRARLGIM
jgi:hypothetical protein